MMIADAVVYVRRKIKSLPLWVLFHDTRSVFSKDELNAEIAKIAIPATLGLMADPIASLIDTAFIGHLGPVELAAVGVAIAVFNQASKIAIFPLVSVTTSFVAEEDSATSSGSVLDDIELEESSNLDDEKMLLLMKHVIWDSPMLSPAYKYLTLRSLGAPAILLSLAMQGVFRGFKDTKTPLYAIRMYSYLGTCQVMGDIVNIVLDPILIFVFKMRVTGAAIAHVFSQYLISVILLWKLIEQVDLLPPNIKDLQLGRFLKNGFLLLVRVIAATFCVTLAASLSARLGSTQMAAFQICLQVWLAASLLTDGLAVAGQAILAGAFARRDYENAKATAGRVLQLALALGLILSFIVGVGLSFSSGVFTKDVKVLQILSLGVPVLVALASIVCLSLLSSHYGFVGIWVALSIFMSLRALAGVWRIGTASGPWSFLNVY
ncbi:hypothetical protein L1987_51007 [Smallanthus sonchifolius]|uniref:Uncharacterized protein n=1 Tax=Smallanthus sonchifolius TaxID=185202 RepID=A0ACB9EPN9_9ASTR|nr:hypothetical protein L1987_51007 [Smallanthus sonchifolius]